MKRILLLALTNIAVMLVLSISWSIISRVFGIQTNTGMGSIIFMGLIFGFGGAIVSLLLSKYMAKTTMGVQIIENPATAQERWLVETVRHHAEKVGIGMPEVGIFNSADPNAFATGANRNSALVAVSTGLLQRMQPDEVEAVLGHEIGHVANGDMVTQSLLQGVLNAFVMIFAQLIGLLVDNLLRGNRDGGSRSTGFGYYIGSWVAQILLGFLATIIVMWFSRHREFKADIAGAELAGRQKMINALKRLQQNHNPKDLPGEMAAFGISGGGNMSRLFMTHPPLEERIAALEAAGR